MNSSPRRIARALSAWVWRAPSHSGLAGSGRDHAQVGASITGANSIVRRVSFMENVSPRAFSQPGSAPAKSGGHAPHLASLMRAADDNLSHAADFATAHPG